jgi:integron integrase
MTAQESPQEQAAPRGDRGDLPAARTVPPVPPAVPARPAPAAPSGSLRALREAVIAALRVRHRSPRTEKAYLAWIRRFIRFHGGRHPAGLGEAQVAEFLTALAVRRHVAASTQNQALAALLFLYREVLGVALPWPDQLVRAQRPERLPVVLGRPEVGEVLARLAPPYRLVGLLLYGSGLRLMECLTLRVKDLDFTTHQLTVREGKGDKDRRTVLPLSVADELRRQLDAGRQRHAAERARGQGWVALPTGLERKFPGAGRDWPWQWVFPATRTYRHEPTGQQRRHHLHETAVQRAVRAAARAAGLHQRVTCHTFRHSFATHLLEDGYDIRTVQELLCHGDVRTTMIYTHVLNRGYAGVRSPADRLLAGIRAPSDQGAPP